MIRIQDNTIRDGMQQSNVRKSLIIKKEVLKQINKLNINSVEVGMCTTIEDEFNIHQFRDILSPEKELVAHSYTHLPVKNITVQYTL
ncbi:hypothetical protein GQX51_00705 [Staphylococcus aureus]|nr:hypothetical protein [Staphylococcus aureus]